MSAVPVCGREKGRDEGSLQRNRRDIFFGVELKLCVSMGQLEKNVNNQK